MESNAPFVTGGAERWPIFDRHGRQIRVGDRLRAQICTGPYGQTKIVEVEVRSAHWTYCQEGGVNAEYDRASNTLRCYHRHVDFEHGHETWAEVIDGTK